ncbi:hypothetical protein CEP54_009189 [Fusarium duplospermum]|uniref:Cell wall protein n=1 Tax=Fusarium duplospermum TaxID=1325734 RepID=A0A428PSB5_9HYPO|nr:hypothetical protein CEP54_009189 [Fusarium duplospermum]
MYFTKLALLVAALAASTISAAPSPKKTEDDFDEIVSLSTDVQRVIDSMPVRGYDASTVHDLFAATVDLVNGISDINKANADVQVEDFDDQEKKDTCTSVHRTRYTQGSLIKQVGDQAERISQFPLSPEIGKLLSVYDREMPKFLDEVNSRLDDCSDANKQYLEENIKTAKAQYDAITPKA